MGKRKKERIDELLTELEDAASAPVVPGEVRSWCEAIARPFGALGERWVDKEDELQADFEQILKEDMEIAPRVEQLKKKRAEISAEFVRLEQVLARLVRADSRDPETSWEPMRQDLLHLALRCRTLDKETETWFIEAFNRDRGTGD